MYSNITATISTNCGADYKLTGEVLTPNTQLAITGPEQICQNIPGNYKKSSIVETKNHQWYFGGCLWYILFLFTLQQH